MLTTGGIAVSGALAAAVENQSDPPMARAIVQAATERGRYPPTQDFQALLGRGIQATVSERVLQIGGPRLLE